LSSLSTRAELSIVVFDGDWRVVWSRGAADQAAVRDACAGAARNAVGRDGAERLFEVDAGQQGRFLALGCPQGDGCAMLLRRAERAGPLFDFIAAVPFATEIFGFMISNPYQAVTVADVQGRMCYISEVHERFLGLKRGEAIGQPAAKVIPNSRLPEVARSGKAEIAQLQHMLGVTRVVNRLPIRRGDEVVGAIGQVLFKEPEAVFRMQRTVIQRRAEQESDTPDHGAAGLLIGRSAPMQRLRREIETVAHLDVPVLVLGESGTGKELVAQAIHRTAHGDGGAPLVSLNLAALPATLIEAELFGYEAGAFTGGNRRGQRGRIEQAGGGTLFLDEVGDIPLEMQVKLLRVLEDRRIEPLGGGESRQVNFRLITATNRHMQGLIDAERFRLDLYYRLSGVVLRIPALRHRREDIPELLQHFVHGFCRRNGMPVPRISGDVIRYLANRDWPGNVRQLRQRVEEALVFCDMEELRVQDFERNAAGEAEIPPAPAPVRTGRLDELAYHAVLRAVAETGGNKKKAAEKLGIARSHLYKILARGG